MIAFNFIYFHSKMVNFLEIVKNPNSMIQSEIVYVQVMMQLIEG